MKKLNLLMIALMSAMTFSLTSCTDECKDVVCENAGTCNEGVCDCATGYEGELCASEERAKFVGSYLVADNCSESGVAGYTVSISNSSAGVTTVLISNFWDAFTNNVTATVEGDKITISSQDPDADGYTVSGNGTISGSVVTINYTVNDGTNSDVCSSTFTKQ